MNVLRETRRPKLPGVIMAGVLAAAFAVALSAGGCRGAGERPETVAEAFLQAWIAGEYGVMYDLLDQTSRGKYDWEYFHGRYTGISSGIGLQDVNYTLGERRENGERNRTRIAFEANLFTYTVGAIKIQNSITLTRADWRLPWRVEWHPGLIFPELTGNRKVSLHREAPRRGSIFDRHGRPLAEYRTFKEVGVVPGRYSDREGLVRAVAALLEIPPRSIEEKLNQPWVKEGLYVPLAVLAPEQETLLPELLRIQGVKINNVERRYYPAGKMLAHVIGYLGELTAEELSEKKEFGYYSGDAAGKLGLEAALEHVLGGQFGFTLRIMEEDGSDAAIIASRELKQGEDVILTIDLDLQQAAEEALAGKIGAVVAMEPATGELLALASSPGFDPNWFTKGLSTEQWQALLADPARPFLNRAIWGLYPPGSTFKALTAAAALDAGVLDPAEKVRIEGEGWQLSPAWGGYQVKRVYSNRTLLDLDEAMRFSDNIYFARVGLVLGPALFESYGDRFGFGEKIPFELPVAVSRLSKNGINTEILLADSSFGQGEIIMTPLHLTLVYCAFAGAGRMPLPRLWFSGEPAPAPWKEAVISPATAGVVHRALINAVSGAEAPTAGTAAGFTAAGKTGTAQVELGGGNICWYITYAPAGAPQIVVTVLVEGGGWAAQDALPLGRAVLESYFQEKADR
jgi:penicillin-binding protein